MLGRKFSLRVLALGFSATSQAAWMALFARDIGPAEFGAFGVALSAGLLAGALLGFGFGTSVLRIGGVMTEREANSARSTMTLVRFGTTSLIAVAIIIAGSVVRGEVSLIVSVAALAVSVELVGELAQGAFSGRRMVRTAAAILVAQRACPLLGLLAGYAAHDVPLGVAFGLIAAVAIPALALGLQITRPSPLGKTISGSRHFWGASIVSNISQLDVPLVSGVAGATTAGFYAVANKVMSPANIFVEALLVILVPELAHMDSAHERGLLFRRARSAAVLAAVAIAVVSYPVAILAVAVLGSGFEDAMPLIVAFMIAAGLSGVSRTYQAMLFAIDRAGAVTLALIVGSLIGLVAIVLLGVMGGPVAIAAAPILAQIAILVGFALALRRAGADVAVRR